MSVLIVLVGLQNVSDDVGSYKKNAADEEGADKPVVVQGIVLPESGYPPLDS